MELPDGMEGGPQSGFEGGEMGGMAQGGGFGTRENPLVSRFLASEKYLAMYEEQLAGLHSSLIESGDAEATLQAYVELLKSEASDLVSVETIDEDAANIQTYLERDADAARTR